MSSAFDSTFASVRAADAQRRSAPGDSEQAILRATAKLLAAVPLHDVSVARIMVEAGVSRATFYRCFSSKDAVVAGLLAQVMDTIYETLTDYAAGAADDDPVERLRRAITVGWDVWTANRPVMSAVAENWHRIPELRDLWLSIIDRFAGVIGGEIDREREEGTAPASSIAGRDLATSLLWASERCVYAAATGVSAAGRDALEAIWIGAIYGQDLR